jgi:hypothetical protein
MAAASSWWFKEGNVTHEFSRCPFQPLALNESENILTRRSNEQSIALKKSTGEIFSYSYYSRYTPAEYIPLYDVNHAARVQIRPAINRRGFRNCDFDANTALPLFSSFDEFTIGSLAFDTVGFDSFEVEYPTSDWGEIMSDETEAGMLENEFWSNDPGVTDPIALDLEMFGPRSEPHPFSDYGEDVFKTVYCKATRMQATADLDSSSYDPDEKLFPDMDINLGQYLMVLMELRVTLKMGDTQVHTMVKICIAFDFFEFIKYCRLKLMLH